MAYAAGTKPDEAAMTEMRRVSLFRNGRNQAVRIPREFELPGVEATIHKEGDRLVIQPLPQTPLREILKGWESIPEEFPRIVDRPPEPVDL
jgi:antitoxin VapB